MDKDISPEEKLLKLIKNRPKQENGVSDASSNENGQKSPQVSEPPPQATPKTERLSHSSFNAPQLKQLFIANKILLGVFMFLILYFFVDYFFVPSVQIKEIGREDVKIEEFLKSEPVKKPFSYYSSEIAGKDVFRPVLREAAETDVAAAAGEEADLGEVASSLSLLGLVSGNKPQAIIQDNKNGKTFFLNVGDTLGEVELKDILEKEGKAVLIYKGKEFDLAM